MSARWLGALAAVLALALDQASKLWLLFGLGMVDRERISVAPFVDFILLFNPGISYSLFPQQSPTGRWILLAATLGATLLLCFWLWRSTRPIASLALGAIIGGALGNGVDRFAYGAVVDFVDLHVGARHWYVFNVADSAITIGVVLLLVDAFWTESRDRSTVEAGRRG